MPIGAQPPGRDGSADEPYSPLNLRLALAVFGLVISLLLAWWSFHVGWTVFAWLLVGWAVVALIDAGVVQARRRARSRAEGGKRHSLFE